MVWLSPVSLLLLGLLLMAPMLLLRRRVLAGLGAVLVLLGLLLMTPLGANALVGAIEAHAEPVATECERIDAIVLLAGGLRRSPSDPEDFDALTSRSLARSFALVQRHRDPDLPLLVAGGGRFRITEAEVMGALLQRLDHGHADPMLETNSRTTWENAAGARELLPAHVQRIALASSALHLPRARLVFEEAGFDVCRWPLDRQYIAVAGVGALWPQSSALVKSEAALHELLGLAYYRFRAQWPGRYTPVLEQNAGLRIESGAGSEVSKGGPHVYGVRPWFDTSPRTDESAPLSEE
jgi:uncharacterized SAM-binding protein YcdF (DUF218 family)